MLHDDYKVTETAYDTVTTKTNKVNYTAWRENRTTGRCWSKRCKVCKSGVVTCLRYDNIFKEDFTKNFLLNPKVIGQLLGTLQARLLLHPFDSQGKWTGFCTTCMLNNKSVGTRTGKFGSKIINNSLQLSQYRYNVTNKKLRQMS